MWLGKKAYRLISSFLPELSAISSRLNVPDFYQSDLVMYEMDLSQGAIPEKGHVYLVPSWNNWNFLPRFVPGPIPRARLDGWMSSPAWSRDLNAGFDEIRAGYRGLLYLEVVPAHSPSKSAQATH